jgi:hypothetical protein
VKILGAIELWRTRFDYRQDTVLNASTYLGFLEQLARRDRRQRRRSVELVQIQPALAGGASVAALLARVESH